MRTKHSSIFFVLALLFVMNVGMLPIFGASAQTNNNNPGFSSVLFFQQGSGAIIGKIRGANVVSASGNAMVLKSAGITLNISVDSNTRITYGRRGQGEWTSFVPGNVNAGDTINLDTNTDPSNGTVTATHIRDLTPQGTLSLPGGPPPPPGVPPASGGEPSSGNNVQVPASGSASNQNTSNSSNNANQSPSTTSNQITASCGTPVSTPTIDPAHPPPMEVSAGQSIEGMIIAGHVTNIDTNAQTITIQNDFLPPYRTAAPLCTFHYNSNTKFTAPFNYDGVINPFSIGQMKVNQYIVATGPTSATGLTADAVMFVSSLSPSAYLSGGGIPDQRLLIQTIERLAADPDAQLGIVLDAKITFLPQAAVGWILENNFPYSSATVTSAQTQKFVSEILSNPRALANLVPLFAVWRTNVRLMPNHSACAQASLNASRGISSDRSLLMRCLGGPADVVLSIVRNYIPNFPTVIATTNTPEPISQILPSPTSGSSSTSSGQNSYTLPAPCNTGTRVYSGSTLVGCSISVPTGFVPTPCTGTPYYAGSQQLGCIQ